MEKGGGKRSNYSESRIIYYFVCTRGRSRATMTPIKFIHLLYLPCKHVARPYRDAILDARIFPWQGTEPFPLSLITFRSQLRSPAAPRLRATLSPPPPISSPLFVNNLRDARAPLHHSWRMLMDAQFSSPLFSSLRAKSNNLFSLSLSTLFLSATTT